MVGTFILARTVTSATLPPPNTLKAPVAPPGGGVPGAAEGGAYRDAGRAGGGRGPRPPAEPAPASSLAELGESAGEAVSKVAYSASAAVTSAAQAARDAIAGVLDAGSGTAPPLRRSSRCARRRSTGRARAGRTT